MAKSRDRVAKRSLSVGWASCALLATTAAFVPVGAQPTTSLQDVAHGSAQKHATEIVPLEREHLGIFTAEPTDHCPLSELMLSPTGRYLLSWQPTWRRTTAARNSRTITLSDLDCMEGTRPRAACQVTLQALDGLRPVAWSNDERTLFLVEQDRALVAAALPADLRATRVRDRASLDVNVATTLASIDRTKSIGAVGEARRLAGEMAQVRVAMRTGETVLGFHVRSGSSATALVEAAADTTPVLATTLIVGGTRHPLDARGPELMRTVVTFEGSDRRTISTTGTRIDVGANARMTPNAFESPLVSPADGRWHGAVSRWSATMPEGAPRPTDGALAFDWTNGGDTAQRLRTNGTETIAGRRNGRAWNIPCLSGQGVVPTQEHAVQLGTPHRPLVAIHSTAEVGRSRRRAIYFPGGPAGSATEPANGYIVRKLIGLGYDVDTINYSGSLGSGTGVSGRLRREGVERALERDVDAVLASMAQDEDLLIVGVSLGGLPALVLDRRLAARDHQLLLLEPLLAYQAPARRVSNAEYAEYQTAFEAAMLGLTDHGSIRRFAAYLQRIQRNRSDRPYMAAFGSDDRLSRRFDWSRRVGAQDRVLVVPGDHGFMPFDVDVWTSVRDWLQRLETPTAGADRRQSTRGYRDPSWPAAREGGLLRHRRCATSATHG